MTTPDDRPVVLPTIFTQRLRVNLKICSNTLTSRCYPALLRMIASLALVLLVTISGTLTTYLYDEDAPFAAIVCRACLGEQARFVGFVATSFLA
jgi:hypothetical protein